MAIAKKDPITETYHETPGGKVYASKIPVTTALPSLIVGITGCFRKNIMPASVTTDVKQQRKITERQ
ncbi:MAG: hypothetical protein HBSAPP01_01330 [Candidatus Brocadia sapporoensis]|nr:MAG: hypothetical protein HBSAPP01_01330 [Candidatus Brocadia sapporoensis]